LALPQVAHLIFVDHLALPQVDQHIINKQLALPRFVCQTLVLTINLKVDEFDL
jgi:hypothetical protein